MATFPLRRGATVDQVASAPTTAGLAAPDSATVSEVSGVIATEGSYEL
jgi:hypothetical protein